MVHPAAHGLIRDQDPTLGQQIPDVTEAQGEPDIKPDRLLDDFGREAVAAIADLGHHRWLRLKVTDGKPNRDVTMPTASLSANGKRFPPQLPGSARRLRYPKVFDSAAPPIRPERHVENSIATIRKQLTI